MNRSDDEPHLISADGPVNRRTALLEQRRLDAERAPPTHPEAMERMLRVHLRNVVGAPLSQQLALKRSSDNRAPSGWMLGSGVAVACGTVLGLLGVIQSSAMTLMGGAALGLAGLLGVVGMRRRSASAAGLMAPVTPLFDAPTLEAFDRVLDEAVSELAEAAIERLTAIKKALVRIAHHANGVDEHFTQEDRLYLRECLRRYIPDSLEAFLRVPSAQRKLVLLEGQPSAESTLLRQLTLIQDEIAQREKKIGRSAAEGLMKQDRFLESKRSR